MYTVDHRSNRSRKSFAGLPTGGGSAAVEAVGDSVALDLWVGTLRPGVDVDRCGGGVPVEVPDLLLLVGVRHHQHAIRAVAGVRVDLGEPLAVPPVVPGTLELQVDQHLVEGQLAAIAHEQPERAISSEMALRFRAGQIVTEGTLAARTYSQSDVVKLVLPRGQGRQAGLG